MIIKLNIYKIPILFFFYKALYYIKIFFRKLSSIYYKALKIYQSKNQALSILIKNFILLITIFIDNLTFQIYKQLYNFYLQKKLDSI